MTYVDFIDLTIGTVFDKVQCDKAFDIGKNSNLDGYQKGFASMVYKFFDKKTSATRPNEFAGGGVKNENISSQKLPEELH